MPRIKHLETHLVLVLALGVLFFITNHLALLFMAGALGLVGLFVPKLAAIIHDLWMKLAQAMGFVMSKVLLSVVFFLVVFPLSIFSRIFGGKNGIRLKPGAPSYYTERDFTYTKESIENVW